MAIDPNAGPFGTDTLDLGSTVNGVGNSLFSAFLPTLVSAVTAGGTRQTVPNANGAQIQPNGGAGQVAQSLTLKGIASNPYVWAGVAVAITLAFVLMRK